MNDLSKAFDTLMNCTFINYCGCLVERSGTGYIWARTFYPSWEAVTKAIDDTFKNWKI